MKLPVLRPSQGAAVCGDLGGLINRGPRSASLRGIRPLSTGGKWTERPPGGHYTKGEMPPGTPVRPFIRCFLLHPSPASAAGLRFFSKEAPSPRRSCLPLTREVASPKGLTEGEIRRACCEAGMRRGSWLRVLSLSRLRRQLPRQREPRGWAMPAGRPLRGSQVAGLCLRAGPSEGAKWLGYACGQFPQREPRVGRGSPSRLCLLTGL